MKKIVFHLNCLEQGGAERVVTNLAHQFSSEGYQVIIATEWIGQNEFQIDDKIERVHVGLRDGDEKKGRSLKFLLRVLYLREFMKKEKPDILIAFGQRANYRALMSAVGIKCPVLISIRTDPVGHYDAFSDKVQIPLLFPRAAGCVFQTEGARDFFSPKFQKKSRIILNPIHDKYIGRDKPTERTKTVVHASRIEDFKNQLMLLQAFIKVHERHPDYELKLYGGDSGDGTIELLKACITDYNAESFIHLMGASDSLETEMNDAALFAFSSDWVGLPNALMEAMALGLPVVATDCPCGGPRTIIEHEVNGLLIPIKDQKALEEGMNRLIENPEFAEKLGEQARKLADRANSKAIFLQWKDYINDIIGAR